MQIRRQIAIGIVNRQFPVNHPLPSIRQLSRDLEVSVTTVSLAYARSRAGRSAAAPCRPRLGSIVSGSYEHRP